MQAPAAAAVAPPPPPRPPAAAFLQALEALWCSGSDYLGVQPFQASSCMRLSDSGDYAVPVTAAPGHPPADLCCLVVRGLPCDFTRGGVTEALLGAAGYSAATGVTVVHERAGLAPTLPGVESGLAVLDTVVARVVVPQACAGLPLLPRILKGPGWQATRKLRPEVVPAGELMQCLCRQSAFTRRSPT